MARKMLKDDQGRKDIKSLSLEELQQEMVDLGKAKFRALQVYKWIWQKGVSSFDEMTNVSKDTRAALAERYYISLLELASRKDSEDGAAMTALRSRAC
jgi:23S rRNA (adenine2503-C2)-methyltransferase